MASAASITPSYQGSSAMAESDPIFQSGHEACRFAYAYASQQYAMSAMAKMMRSAGVIGSGRGLVGLDGAAIAGTVKRHVESLRDEWHAAILARYEIEAWKARNGACVLVQFVIPALGTGAHHRHLVRALVYRHFGIPDENGQPIKLASLASQFDMSADTMTRRYSNAKRRLREIECAAQTAIDGVLQGAGIVS